MSDRDQRLDNLPGSRNGGAGGSSNNILMPVPAKPTGIQPQSKQTDREAEALSLGIGGKLPESHDSRMLSQMPKVDMAEAAAKKKSELADNKWGSGVRGSSLPSAPYKSSKAAGDAKGDAPKAAEARAEQAAKEKVKVKAEQTKLFGQKEALLGALCNNPNAQSGDAEFYRTTRIVSDINKKLGLPSSHMGNWKLPD